jgi:hypothetical protein
VLLYRLVTNRYPVEAATVAELRHRHRVGDRVPLLDRRPDIDAAFAAVVDRALAPNPETRFASAGAMATALTRSWRGAGDDPRQQRRWSVGLRTAVLVAAGLVAIVVGGRTILPKLRPADAILTPEAAHLAATFAFLRTGDTAQENLTEGGLVRPGDTLGLELQLSETAHVYVLNEDRAGELYVLFPLADTELTNPLAAGVRHRLPGRRGETRLDWQVTSGRGEERFLVVASRRPLTWLEDRLARLTPSSSDRPVEYAMLEPSGAPPQRGVGGLVAEDSPGAATALLELAARLDAQTEDGTGLWLQHFLLYNLGR